MKYLMTIAAVLLATPVMAESGTAHDRQKSAGFDVEMQLSAETRAEVKAKWDDTSTAFPSFTVADTLKVGQPVSLIGLVTGMGLDGNSADIDCYLDITDGGGKPVEVTLPDCLIGPRKGDATSFYLMQGFSYVPEGEAGQEVRFNILVTDRIGGQSLNFDLVTKLTAP